MLVIRQPKEMLLDQTIVRHLAGSKSYGTNIAGSDIDIRGIFVADSNYYRIPWVNVNEIEIEDEEDTKYYEISKYLELLIDQNPNIMETLWVDEEDIEFRTPAYDWLRLNRDKLLSAKVAHTFSGYAIAQLKRIRGHNKWISNPQPEDAPKQYEFVSLVQSFAEERELGYTTADIIRDQKQFQLVHYGNDVYGMYYRNSPGAPIVFDRAGALVTQQNPSATDFLRTSPPLRIVKFNREVYRTAKEQHKQYWTWKHNRNESRSELERKYGYDSKHAMHLVRLLRMGEEILTTGQVLVKRPDAQELVDIRGGAWSYEQLIAYAEEKDELIRTKLYKTTDLPKKVDRNVAGELLMQAQELAWAE